MGRIEAAASVADVVDIPHRLDDVALVVDHGEPEPGLGEHLSEDGQYGHDGTGLNPAHSGR
jgi:hypothetical protein